MFNIFTRHCLLCLADYLNRVSIAFFVIEHIAAKRGTPRYPIWQQGVPLSLPPTRTARSRTSPGRVSERRTLPLLGLDRVYSRRTQRAFGTAMRCARRCPEGVAAPPGCVIFLLLSKLEFVHPALRAFPRVRGRGVSLPSAHFACSRNAGRPLVKKAYLPFSEAG